MRKFLLTTVGIGVAGDVAVSHGLVTFTPAPGLINPAPDLTLTLDCRGAEADNYEKEGNLTHAQSLRFYSPISGKPAVEELLQLYEQHEAEFDKEYHARVRGADFEYWEQWHKTWKKNHYPYNLVDTIYPDPAKI
jgi:hypothetical protein